MRVIAGEFKGRKLVTFKGNQLRPLTDRIKAAIFDYIQKYIINCTVLDLFSGSGSFGIEALSRGADSVVFVEKYKPAVDLISKNLNPLLKEKSKYRIICKDALDFLKQPNKNRDFFDIIFADPPFKYDSFDKLFNAAAKSDILSEKGIFIIRHPCDVNITEKYDFKEIRNKKFGDSFVKFFIKSGDQN